MSKLPKYKITDYGASTSSGDNSRALLATIKVANGKGIVSIPAGTFTISNTVITGNDIAIEFEVGASLQAPQSRQAYNWNLRNSNGLLTFDNCNNLTMTGDGNNTINGNGKLWWRKPYLKGASIQGPPLIAVTDSKNVKITRIDLVDSPYYNVNLFNSDTVKVTKLTIKTSDDAPNSDGVHVTDGVSNLTVKKVTFNTGEDAVAINSNGAANSNIKVIKCTVLSGHGLSIGSQVFGAFSNVLFDSNTVSNCDYGCRIKCRTGKDGKGVLNGVTFSNLTFKDISNTGIYVTTTYNANGTTLPPNKVVTFQNVLFSNITGDTIKTGIVVDIATSKQVLSPITFSNITMTNVDHSTVVNKNDVPVSLNNVNIS